MLLFDAQNRVFGRFGDSEFNDGFGRNLDLYSSFWIDAVASFPLLLYQLSKSRKDKLAFFFDPFVGEARERIEEESGRFFGGLRRFSKRELKLGFGHGVSVLCQ